MRAFRLCQMFARRSRDKSIFSSRSIGDSPGGNTVFNCLIGEGISPVTTSTSRASKPIHTKAADLQQKDLDTLADAISARTERPNTNAQQLMDNDNSRVPTGDGASKWEVTDIKYH